MLNKLELYRLSEIVELAVSKMEELELPDFDLAGASWNDDDSQWEVKFYSDYGDVEYTTVFVTPVGAEFRLSGYMGSNE
ncbi:hypothetical protein CAL7716_085790 [Calothrix sp. PCC 7716]|nr:hypothetical protein CAL7716_085790 [Calothrix sp. PCC 7716]